MAKKVMTFDTRLATFVKSTKTSMAAALDCSIMAIEHFKAHGDLTYAQRFLDAMPKNYIRRAAFLKWLVAHAPITMESGKLIKDKSETAIEFNIEGAKKQPFWEFAPEVDAVLVSFDDAMKKLHAALAFFKKAKVKTDATTLSIVGDLEKMLTEREKQAKEKVVPVLKAA